MNPVTGQEAGMSDGERTSRLPGFYQQSLAARGQAVQAWAGLSAAQ